MKYSRYSDASIVLLRCSNTVSKRCILLFQRFSLLLQRVSCVPVLSSCEVNSLIVRSSSSNSCLWYFTSVSRAFILSNQPLKNASSLLSVVLFKDTAASHCGARGEPNDPKAARGDNEFGLRSCICFQSASKGGGFQVPMASVYGRTYNSASAYAACG